MEAVPHASALHVLRVPPPLLLLLPRTVAHAINGGRSPSAPHASEASRTPALVWLVAVLRTANACSCWRLQLWVQEETSVPCECNEYVGELQRGVRQHLGT